MKRTTALFLAIAAALLTGCEYRGSVTAADPAAQSEQETGLISGITDRTDDFAGSWVEQDSAEKWVFGEDGTLAINGEEHSYSAKWSVFGGRVLTIDGEHCGYTVRYDGSISFEYGGRDVRLWGEDSDEYKKTVRGERLESECAELLARYPDSDGWLEQHIGGDIPFLADADYIDGSLGAFGYFCFEVSTPQQLASAVWFVNTQQASYPLISLSADIDLSGYEWAPMGWSGGRDDHPFGGILMGNGHTISGMTINESAGDAGFIGWETFCSVENITFDKAQVNGSGFAGVVAGQAIGGSYTDVTVKNSTVTGSRAGSMLGWDANAHKKNCTADVTVNGEAFAFLSYNEKEKSEIVIDNPVTITLDEQTHEVTRPEVEGYTNLGWIVTYNGEQVLHRNAEGEYSYAYFREDAGYYEIYLTAYVSGQYVPISNIVSYTIN